MLHFLNRSYICPLPFSDIPEPEHVGNHYVEDGKMVPLGEATCSEILAICADYPRQRSYFLRDDEFYTLLRTRHLWLFRHTSLDQFQQHLAHYQIDVRLKANRFDYEAGPYYAMRSFRTSALDRIGAVELPQRRASYGALGFELLLYNALRSDNPDVWGALLGQVEALSWKKLIYDWLVLKNQITNAFSNDLSLLLPAPQQIPEEPRERLAYLKSSRFFAWMFDPGFTPENWAYVRDHYDPETYAVLYSSWVRYRSRQPLDASNPQFVKLRTVIRLITEKRWRELLEKDLTANWVSVYIESSDYKLFNLALVGKIYDAHSRRTLDELSFLELSSQAFA